MQLDDIKITLSKRKTIALHIHEDGNVELRAPYGVNRRVLVDMVSEKSHWIKQKKAQCDERLSHLKAHKIEWKDGAEVPFYQQPLVLSYRFGRQQKILRNTNQLIITAPTSTPEVIKSLYFKWLRGQAKTLFVEKARYWSRQLYSDVQHPLQIQPRLMCSRWGSCSKNKSLRLNLVLMMLPEDLIDYVIVHELCHWQVFNHSPKFYQLQQSVMPNWKHKEQQLRLHQYLLMESKG